MAIYVFSSVTPRGYIYYEFVIYAIVLKLKNLELSKGVLMNDLTTHSELAQLLRKAHLAKTNNPSTYSIFGVLADWHTYMTQDSIVYGKGEAKEFQTMFPLLAQSFDGVRYYFQPEKLFSNASKKIDLSID